MPVRQYLCLQNLLFTATIKLFHVVLTVHWGDFSITNVVLTVYWGDFSITCARTCANKIFPLPPSFLFQNQNYQNLCLPCLFFNSLQQNWHYEQNFPLVYIALLFQFCYYYSFEFSIIKTCDLLSYSHLLSFLKSFLFLCYINSTNFIT